MAPPSPHEKQDGHLNMDTLLIETLGQFGRYQFRTVAFCTLSTVILALPSSSFVFMTARIPTRCLIPECDGTTPEFSPAWLTNAVPSSGAAFDNCARYATTISKINYTKFNKNKYESRTSHANIIRSDINDTCPSTIFDNRTNIPCDEYVYENTDSVVYDFNLGCDEWKRTFLGSIRAFGNLLALPIAAFISDRWGRRKAVLFCATNIAWPGFVRYWCSSYFTYAILEFIESSTGPGIIPSCYTLMMELVGPKYRVAVGSCLTTGLALGNMLLAWIAWAVPDWRQMTLFVYTPQLLLISLYWLLFESVRWLMTNGKHEETEIILKKIAKVNQNPISKDALASFRAMIDGEQNKSEINNNTVDSEDWLLLLVFKHKPVLVRCIVCPALWITTMLVFYGLTLNSVNLSGNSYVNFAAVTAVQIPGFWLATLANRFGRKPILTGGFWICGACLMAFMILPRDYFIYSMIIYLVGKTAISLVVSAIYVYTAEIFPTQYRQRLFSFCSMIGRLGSIGAPLTPALSVKIWSELPFAIFTGFCMVSGLLMFLLPETMGAKLPDTMEEADLIGVKKRHRNHI